MILKALYIAYMWVLTGTDQVLSADHLFETSYFLAGSLDFILSNIQYLQCSGQHGR